MIGLPSLQALSQAQGSRDLDGGGGHRYAMWF
jgi:hypothetical protein